MCAEFHFVSWFIDHRDEHLIDLEFWYNYPRRLNPTPTACRFSFQWMFVGVMIQTKSRGSPIGIYSSRGKHKVFPGIECSFETSHSWPRAVSLVWVKSLIFRLRMRLLAGKMMVANLVRWKFVVCTLQTVKIRTSGTNTGCSLGSCWMTVRNRRILWRSKFRQMT